MSSASTTLHACGLFQERLLPVVIPFNGPSTSSLVRESFTALLWLSWVSILPFSCQVESPCPHHFSPTQQSLAQGWAHSEWSGKNQRCLGKQAGLSQQNRIQIATLLFPACINLEKSFNLSRTQPKSSVKMRVQTRLGIVCLLCVTDPLESPMKLVDPSQNDVSLLTFTIKGNAQFQGEVSENKDAAFCSSKIVGRWKSIQGPPGIGRPRVSNTCTRQSPRSFLCSYDSVSTKHSNSNIHTASLQWQTSENTGSRCTEKQTIHDVQSHSENTLQLLSTSQTVSHWSPTTTL